MLYGVGKRLTSGDEVAVSLDHQLSLNKNKTEDRLWYNVYDRHSITEQRVALTRKCIQRLMLHVDSIV